MVDTPIGVWHLRPIAVSASRTKLIKTNFPFLVYVMMGRLSRDAILY